MKDKKLSKSQLSKLIIIGVELVICLFIILFFMVRAAYNTSEKAHSADAPRDVISTEEGCLRVNQISLAVPSENAQYRIAYEWAEDDDEYPTVPTAALASYHDAEGNILYDIVLYKDDYTSKSLASKKLDVATWFDDWEEKTTDTVDQKKYSVNGLHGFLTYAHPSESKSDINYSYTYYFVTEAYLEIEQYAVEITFYNSDITPEEMSIIFNNCINSIQIENAQIA